MAKHRTASVNGGKDRGIPTTAAMGSNKRGRGASRHSTRTRNGGGDSIRINHSGREIGKELPTSRPHHHLKGIGGKTGEDNGSGDGREMTPRQPPLPRQHWLKRQRKQRSQTSCNRAAAPPPVGGRTQAMCKRYKQELPNHHEKKWRAHFSAPFFLGRPFFLAPFCFSAGKRERKKERSDAYVERAGPQAPKGVLGCNTLSPKRRVGLQNPKP